jgi:hypothetical protein
MSAKQNPTPRPDMLQPHRAGDIESFPGGKVIYLSPTPLPTKSAPLDFNQAIGEVNDAYLDFGGNLPTPFTWQVVLGVPFISSLWIVVLTPLVLGWLTSNEELSFASEFMAFFDITLGMGLWGGAIFLALALFIKAHYHFKFREAVPTRFHRQRREVAFAPGGGKPPIIVPWESVAAWVTQAQGMTQYGVQRQYGLGIGFIEPETGQQHFIELSQPGMPFHLAEWEISAIQKAERKTLPASLDEWSQPLPEAQWAKPSEELMRLSKEVRQRHAQQPNRPITAIFAEVYGEEASLSA